MKLAYYQSYRFVTNNSEVLESLTLDGAKQNAIYWTIQNRLCKMALPHNVNPSFVTEISIERFLSYAD